MKKVCIVILNYKKYQDTIECLESIYNSIYDNYNVVVCDNNSPNESEKVILNWKEKNKDKPFKYIQTKSNLGFAGGNNIGIRYALSKGADYIWLLNNDTVIEEYTLYNLVKKMESNDSIGVCGSRLLYYHDKKTVQGLAGKYNKFTGIASHIIKEKDLCRLSYIIGASMLIKKEVILDIGFLSEDYFLYYEELDFAERLKNKYKTDIALDSVVFHKEGSSIVSGSEFSFYYLFKNSLVFTKKYYKLLYPSVLFFVILRIICPWKKRKYNKFKMLCKVLRTI